MAEDLVEIRDRIGLTESHLKRLTDHVYRYFLSSVKLETVYGVNAVGSPTYELIASAIAYVPTALKSEANDLFHAYRSVLDSLVCILAERNGKSITRDTYFPISKTKSILEANGIRKIRNLRQEDQQTILSFEPFWGGNKSLAALHEVDKMGKHVRLAPQVIMQNAFSIAGVVIGPGVTFDNCRINGHQIDKMMSRNPADQKPLGKQMTTIAEGIGRMPPIEPHVELCYSLPEQVKGREVIGMISEFHSEVCRIVNVFD